MTQAMMRLTVGLVALVASSCSALTVPPANFTRMPTESVEDATKGDVIPFLVEPETRQGIPLTINVENYDPWRERNLRARLMRLASTAWRTKAEDLANGADWEAVDVESIGDRGYMSGVEKIVRTGFVVIREPIETNPAQ